MDIDVEKVPAFIILILWAVFTAIMAVGGIRLDYREMSIRKKIGDER